MCDLLPPLVASVLFNLRVISNSLADISTHIGDVLKLSSRANLPSLVNLALSVNHALNDNVLHM